MAGAIDRDYNSLARRESSRRRRETQNEIHNREYI